jgi:hypothetical protein
MEDAAALKVLEETPMMAAAAMSKQGGGWSFWFYLGEDWR